MGGSAPRVPCRGPGAPGPAPCGSRNIGAVSEDVAAGTGPSPEGLLSRSWELLLRAALCVDNIIFLKIREMPGSGRAVHPQGPQTSQWDVPAALGQQGLLLGSPRKALLGERLSKALVVPGLSGLFQWDLGRDMPV